MFLLYVDDSGSPGGVQHDFYVLGGVAVFERQVHWVGLDLDAVAAKFDKVLSEPVELHGSPMLNGREGWGPVERPDRMQAIKDALGVLNDAKKSTVAFGVAVRKSSIPGLDPVEWAFEALCQRFDAFLKQYRPSSQGTSRAHNKVSLEAQRGLMIFDENAKETTLQELAIQFRRTGHSAGLLRNIAEVPLFVDSRATRLVQLADLIAYSLFRYVERSDSQFLDVIRHRFHRVGGQEVGLLIKTN